MLRKFLTLFALFFGTVLAAEYVEPERGSQVRKAMLDAMRPHAEWELGGPIEFVVDEMRHAGAAGFVSVRAQRPGGKPIDVYKTPGYARGDFNPDAMEDMAMQALLRRSGDTWVAVHWAIAATDVWYAYAPYCRRYREVLPILCEGLEK